MLYYSSLQMRVKKPQRSTLERMTRPLLKTPQKKKPQLTKRGKTRLQMLKTKKRK